MEVTKYGESKTTSLIMGKQSVQIWPFSFISFHTLTLKGSRNTWAGVKVFEVGTRLKPNLTTRDHDRLLFNLLCFEIEKKLHCLRSILPISIVRCRGHTTCRIIFGNVIQRSNVLSIRLLATETWNFSIAPTSNKLIIYFPDKP